MISLTYRDEAFSNDKFKYVAINSNYFINKDLKNINLVDLNLNQTTFIKRIPGNGNNAIFIHKIKNQQKPKRI